MHVLLGRLSYSLLDTSSDSACEFNVSEKLYDITNFFFVFLGGSDTVEFPIKFTPKNAGFYHCQILLKSSCDIRVYEIECVVNAEQADVQLEFLTPAYQTVTQEIPIVSSLYYC